jgi:hypothetical protein
MQSSKNTLSAALVADRIGELGFGTSTQNPIKKLQQSFHFALTRLLRPLPFLHNDMLGVSALGRKKQITFICIVLL